MLKLTHETILLLPHSNGFMGRLPADHIYFYSLGHCTPRLTFNRVDRPCVGEP